MKNYLLLLSLSAPILGFSQWSKTSLKSVQKVNEAHQYLESKEVYSFDAAKLKTALLNAPSRSATTNGVFVNIPNVNGKIERFEVWESSNMAPDLQAKYMDIRSYVGRSTTDPSAYLRFSISPQGFSSLILRSGISEYIEPYTTDSKSYIVYDSNMRKQNAAEKGFECNVIGEAESTIDESAGRVLTAGTNTYRLALSVTGEYSQYHLTKNGIPSTATDAEKKAVVLAAMNASLTRLNGVYEKDLSIHYNLIS